MACCATNAVCTTEGERHEIEAARDGRNSHFTASATRAIRAGGVA
jgi:hypothetical protein